MNGNIFAKIDINGSAVYIYRRSGPLSAWNMEAILSKSDFGLFPAVAIKGDTILVGAYDRRIVFIYQYDYLSRKWSHNPANITNRECSGNMDWFGGYVAITEENRG